MAYTRIIPLWWRTKQFEVSCCVSWEHHEELSRIATLSNHSCLYWNLKTQFYIQERVIPLAVLFNLSCLCYLEVLLPSELIRQFSPWPGARASLSLWRAVKLQWYAWWGQTPLRKAGPRAWQYGCLMNCRSSVMRVQIAEARLLDIRQWWWIMMSVARWLAGDASKFGIKQLTNGALTSSRQLSRYEFTRGSCCKT